jgi:hypothetical protein
VHSFIWKKKKIELSLGKVKENKKEFDRIIHRKAVCGWVKKGLNLCGTEKKVQITKYSIKK